MNEMLISRLNDLYAKTDYSITMTEFVYQQGRADESERIINILQKHWLSGSVAHRIIDEIIDDIEGKDNIKYKGIVETRG